jgi:hypothetical protein
MTDPTAAGFVKIDYEGNWWVYDEIYQTDLHLDQLVYVLRDKMGDDSYSPVFLGDGAARFELESLRKRRFRITGARKGADSIANGIKEVKALLHVREGTGKPKIFLRAINYQKLPKESLRFTRFFRDSSAVNITNVPEDKNNHAMDWVRYLALDRSTPARAYKKKEGI